MGYRYLEPFQNNLEDPPLTPRKITGIYVLFGLVFLVLSDILWPMMVTDPLLLRRLQGVKGAVEVLITGGVIYVLVARMEGQLERQEHRYRNLIENSPAPINLFDEKGVSVWGNEAVVDLLGLEDREDLVGRSIFDFIHPDDHDIARGELAEVIDRGEVVGPTQFRLVRDDGEIKHVQVTTTDGWFDGSKVGQAVVNDVTELKRTQEDLRAERDFIRDALNELDDVFFFIDPDGYLQRWNEEFSRIAGLDDGETADIHATEFVAEGQQDRVRSSIDTALETGEGYVEVDVETADDGARRYEVKSARLDTPAGTAKGIVGIGRDITERNRMERELRENERRYRTLVEMSPNPVVVHIDGEIVFANEAAVELVSAETAEDLVGTGIGRYLHSEDSEGFIETAKAIQRGEVSSTRELNQVHTLDGQLRWIQSTSRPIAYHGAPAVLSVIQDVTDRERYEEMLTQLNERNQSMMRAADQQAIADIAVSTITDLLGTDGSGFFSLDDRGRLQPWAWAGEGDVRLADLDEIEPGNEAIWEAFSENEERRVSSDTDGLPVRELLVLPIGNHGVLVAGNTGELDLEGTDRRIADLIRDNVIAALDRSTRETALQDRDRQLERQNEALKQLNRLNEVIRQINQTLIKSTTKAEVLAAVCDRLSQADEYTCAWIGRQDPVDGSIEPSHWAGMDRHDLDGVGVDRDESPMGRMLAAAIDSKRIQTAQELLEDPAWEPHRRELLNQGYRAVAVVPILQRGSPTGVIVIHAVDADIFDERERLVLEELGETVGYALANIERSEAIRADDRTEIELAIEDDRLITNAIADAVGADVEFVGTIEDSSGQHRLFVRIKGHDEEGFADRLESVRSVSAVQVLGVDESNALVQLTATQPSLFGLLREFNGTLRRLETTDGTARLVVVFSDSNGVRPFVEAVERSFPDTDLRARRENADPVETRETFQEGLIDQLTEKQLAAVRTAYYGGFYQWPRATTSEALAETRDIAPSTFQYHLRAAERKLMDAIFA